MLRLPLRTLLLRYLVSSRQHREDPQYICVRPSQGLVTDADFSIVVHFPTGNQIPVF